MNDNLPYPTIVGNNTKLYNSYEISYNRNKDNGNILLMNDNYTEIGLLTNVPSPDLSLSKTNYGDFEICSFHDNHIKIKKSDNYSQTISLGIFSEDIIDYSEIQLIIFINNVPVLYRNETIQNKKIKFINMQLLSAINENDKIHIKIFFFQDNNNNNLLNIQVTNFSWIIKNI